MFILADFVLTCTGLDPFFDGIYTPREVWDYVLTEESLDAVDIYYRANGSKALIKAAGDRKAAAIKIVLQKVDENLAAKIG